MEVALAEKTVAHDIAQGRIEDLEKQVQDVENLNRTINLLVSEKNSLSASLEQLAAVESRTSHIFSTIVLALTASTRRSQRGQYQSGHRACSIRRSPSTHGRGANRGPRRC
jgi:hypothetical protein